MTEDFKKGIEFAERRLMLKIETLIETFPHNKTLPDFIYELQQILSWKLLSCKPKAKKE